MTYSMRPPGASVAASPLPRHSGGRTSRVVRIRTGQVLTNGGCTAPACLCRDPRQERSLSPKLAVALQRGDGAEPVEARLEPAARALAAEVAQVEQKVPAGVQLARIAEPGHVVLGIDAVDQHPFQGPLLDQPLVDQSGDEADRPQLPQERRVEADLVDPVQDL